MRTILWFIYFFLYLIAVLPLYFKAKRLKNSNKIEECDELVNSVVQKWADNLLKAAGATVDVVGEENIPKNEAVLFIANHQSNFDIPILLTYLNKAHPLLSKVEVGKIPLIKQWMQLLNCVFLDRSNAKEAVIALGKVTENVKNGYSCIIFPEGTRSKGGPVGEFKSGAFKIAEKTKVKIVPIVINGSYKLMEANGRFIKPASVKVEILPPIVTENYTREEFRGLPDVLENIISQKVENNIM